MENIIQYFDSTELINIIILPIVEWRMHCGYRKHTLLEFGIVNRYIYTRGLCVLMTHNSAYNWHDFQFLMLALFIYFVTIECIVGDERAFPICGTLDNDRPYFK